MSETRVLFVFLVFFFFGQAMQLDGSQFPDQGLNPDSLQWELGVRITGPLGNSQEFSLLIEVDAKLKPVGRQTGLQTEFLSTQETLTESLPP